MVQHTTSKADGASSTASKSQTVRSRRQRVTEYVVFALLLVLAASAILYFFEQLPIEGTSLGIDWFRAWNGLQGGKMLYSDSTGLRIAPWTLPVVVPLGYLSFRSSWGVLVLGTLAVLILSVPRTGKRWLHWLSILLLITSFPAMRHAVDGNFEALTIGGVLLIVAGFRQGVPWLLAAGLLLGSAKPQETWILLAVVGWYLLRSWPPGKIARLALIVGPIVLLGLLLAGSIWIGGMGAIVERGSIMDVSLMAATTRAGFGQAGTIVCWAGLLGASGFFSLSGKPVLNREKAAMLMCTSQLLAPYTAGNSYLSILAVGVIPFFQSNRLLGTVLLILTNVMYLFPRDIAYWWSAYYTTGLLLVIWAILGWTTYRTEATRRSGISEPDLAPRENVS